MKLRFITGIFFLISFSVFGQEGHQNYFQGYAGDVGGKNFGYHSPLPGVNTSLLLRGQADYDPIEWITETVPAYYSGEFISFIWLFGMDVTSDPVDFQLSINDKTWFSFGSSQTSDLGPRTIKGEDGAELTLNVTMLDKYADQMGFAIVKIPTKAITPGEAVRMKVSTHTVNNNAWFMTFKTAIKENVELYQNKVVVKDEGRLFHSVSADFIHIGPDALAIVTIDGNTSKTTLKAGFNKLEINLPKVEDTTILVANVVIENQEQLQKTFILAPIREWEIFLVQHTHTDIGYTRPQTEILPEHLRYIDNALDFCDQTDDYPDDAKFRWTCETSWSVREYLRAGRKPKSTGSCNASPKAELKLQVCS